MADIHRPPQHCQYGVFEKLSVLMVLRNRRLAVPDPRTVRFVHAACQSAYDLSRRLLGSRRIKRDVSCEDFVALRAFDVAEFSVKV